MKQGEIWLVTLEPSVGAEMRKTRPALIVSADALGRLPLKIVVPITDWKERFVSFPWMVKIEPSEKNGLAKESAVDCFQIRSVSVERLTVPVGAAEPKTIAQVRRAVSQLLERYETA